MIRLPISELVWIVPGPVETPADLDALHRSVVDEEFKGQHVAVKQLGTEMRTAIRPAFYPQIAVG